MKRHHLFVWAAGALTTCSAAFAGNPVVTRFVDANATGPVHDGTSWCSAYLTVDDALAAAAAGDTIHVADGVYVPDPTGLGNSRDATFLIDRNLILRGGFAGCGAADPDLQDQELHETVLSGDLNDDDGANFANQSDNARHVMTIATTATFCVVEGFTITAGSADGTCCGVTANGGGLYIDQVSPFLTDVTFLRNSANRGGGVFTDGGNPTFNGCSFVENRALFGLETGGAIFVDGGAPVLTNCLMLDNIAFVGGAMTVAPMSNVSVENNTFSGNYAISNGGAILSAGSLTIDDSIIWGNVGKDGANLGESGQLFSTGGTLTVNHTIVQGLTGGLGGVGNLADDPLFAPGPLGCHYLSQTSDGYEFQSPAIDAGSATAMTLGLNMRTTGGGEVGDSGTVDLGFHFRVTGRPQPFGDADRSGTRDLRDVAAMQNSFGSMLSCSVLDSDLNEVIDLIDAGAMSDQLTGP